jgi:hypothetical protein
MSQHCSFSPNTVEIVANRFEKWSWIFGLGPLNGRAPRLRAKVFDSRNRQHRPNRLDLSKTAKTAGEQRSCSRIAVAVLDLVSIASRRVFDVKYQ